MAALYEEIYGIFINIDNNRESLIMDKCQQIPDVCESIIDRLGWLVEELRNSEAGEVILLEDYDYGYDRGLSYGNALDNYLVKATDLANRALHGRYGRPGSGYPIGCCDNDKLRRTALCYAMMYTNPKSGDTALQVVKYYLDFLIEADIRHIANSDGCLRILFGNKVGDVYLRKQ